MFVALNIVAVHEGLHRGKRIGWGVIASVSFLEIKKRDWHWRDRKLQHPLDTLVLLLLSPDTVRSFTPHSSSLITDKHVN